MKKRSSGSKFGHVTKLIRKAVNLWSDIRVLAGFWESVHRTKLPCSADCSVMNGTSETAGSINTGRRQQVFVPGAP